MQGCVDFAGIIFRKIGREGANVGIVNMSKFEKNALT